MPRNLVMGNVQILPTAPAIANAIYDAIGVRIKDIPITPHKILAALSKGEGCIDSKLMSAGYEL